MKVHNFNDSNSQYFTIPSIKQVKTNNAPDTRNLNISNKEVTSRITTKIKSTERYNVIFNFDSQTSKVYATLLSKDTNESKDILSNNLSQNFYNIRNENEFYTFIDAIHIKVAELSDGNYKIYDAVSGVGGARQRTSVREHYAGVRQGIRERAEDEGLDVDGMNSRQVKGYDENLNRRYLNLWDQYGAEVLEFGVQAVANHIWPAVAPFIPFIIKAVRWAWNAISENCNIM